MGSFLGMLQYRLPLQKSLIDPKRSFCPICKTPVKWYENIPLLSYIILRGKCSGCKEKISLVYPTIELITALITYGLYQKFGLSLDLLLMLLVFYTLILLSFIDLEYKAVPDYLLVIVLICGAFYSEFSYLYCLVFAGVGVLLDFFVSFYIQNIKARIVKDETLQMQKALGEGDIPIFALIGGVLGVQLGIIAIFIAAVFALIPSLLSHIMKGDKELPFIPFLSLGFFLSLFFNESIFLFVERILNI
jgi:leader peptidase (prepilin peptidase) / N-methyltransferase